jgi:hypothetical protein
VTPYQRGQAARRAGRGVFANPYVRDNKAKAWTRGWHAAQPGDPGLTDRPPLGTRRGGGIVAAGSGCGITVNTDLPRDEGLNPAVDRKDSHG